MHGQDGFQAEGAARDAAESLPAPLDHILSEVFRCYEARTPEQLLALMRARYREDATFIDPTLVSRPRRNVALTFFSMQHLFSSVQVTDISQAAVRLVPPDKGKGTELLKVLVQSRQMYEFARGNHISQQILPESTHLEAATRLLLDPRTGRVVLHEDAWLNKPALRLPMLWRRLNGMCVTGVYRLLGWGRVLDAAEARAEQQQRAGWTDS